jgi:hypothetical protein
MLVTDEYSTMTSGDSRSGEDYGGLWWKVDFDWDPSSRNQLFTITANLRN